jgi:arsenite-transporting ATPase
MSPRLHLLLGPGGVGKTTLAAGYALALARAGGRVGLLGVDPSRRLQDALGVTLADREVMLPDAGELRAAILEPHHAIERWIGEACEPGERDRLLVNPFFAALGDQLATATDLLAAVRIAEWAERDPHLTDLVVDTAPGLAALDLLRTPARLAALGEGRMVGWLSAAARTSGHVHGIARRVLGGLGELGGARLVLALADFFALIHAPLRAMFARVEVARAWIASSRAELLLVTSPRDTAAAGARQLADALAHEHLALHAAIVNRTWPSGLAGTLDQLAGVPEAAALVGYARAQLAAQTATIAAAARLAPRLAVLPSLGSPHRDELIALGERLVIELAAIHEPTRRAS